MIPVIITACGNYNTWNLKGDNNFDLFENQRDSENDKPLIILTSCENISDIDDIIVNLFMKTFKETEWEYNVINLDYSYMSVIIFDEYKEHLQVEYFHNDKFVNFNIERGREKFKNALLLEYESIDNPKFNIIIYYLIEHVEYYPENRSIAFAIKNNLSVKELLFDI